MHTNILNTTVLGLAVTLRPAHASYAPAASQSQEQERGLSQRARMQEVEVASPDSKVKFTILANAKRLEMR